MRLALERAVLGVKVARKGGLAVPHPLRALAAVGDKHRRLDVLPLAGGQRLALLILADEGEVVGRVGAIAVSFFQTFPIISGMMRRTKPGTPTERMNFLTAAPLRPAAVSAAMLCWYAGSIGLRLSSTMIGHLVDR